LYAVNAETISSSLTASTEKTVTETGFNNLPVQETFDSKIDPTKSFDARETVVIVGGGAGGAAAVVKLPLVEQAAALEPQADVKPTVSSSVQPEELLQVRQVSKTTVQLWN
ncbi:hypothetical protein ElyMa_000938100, partial [Elysia marginata]